MRRVPHRLDRFARCIAIGHAGRFPAVTAVADLGEAPGGVIDGLAGRLAEARSGLPALIIGAAAYCEVIWSNQAQYIGATASP